MNFRHRDQDSRYDVDDFDYIPNPNPGILAVIAVWLERCVYAARAESVRSPRARLDEAIEWSVELSSQQLLSRVWRQQSHNRDPLRREARDSLRARIEV